MTIRFDQAVGARGGGDREGRQIRAGIFEMDGVLINSEPLHHRAVNEILAAEGRDGLSLDEYRPYFGTTDQHTWGDLVHRLRLPRPASTYCDRFDMAIVEQYRRFPTIAPGARELLDELKARGLPLAIASSSRLRWIVTCLAALGIRSYFDALVYGTVVTPSKPAPDIYFLAARRLGVPPAQCFAIESSPNGVVAAVGAGMFTIAIDTPYAQRQRVGGAHVHVPSLFQVDCSLLEAGAPPVR